MLHGETTAGPDLRLQHSPGHHVSVGPIDRYACAYDAATIGVQVEFFVCIEIVTCALLGCSCWDGRFWVQFDEHVSSVCAYIPSWGAFWLKNVMAAFSVHFFLDFFAGFTYPGATRQTAQATTTQVM
jgi:hypothetical protein